MNGIHLPGKIMFVQLFWHVPLLLLIAFGWLKYIFRFNAADNNWYWVFFWTVYTQLHVTYMVMVAANGSNQNVKLYQIMFKKTCTRPYSKKNPCNFLIILCKSEPKWILRQYQLRRYRCKNWYWAVKCFCYHSRSFIFRLRAIFALVKSFKLQYFDAFTRLSSSKSLRLAQVMFTIVTNNVANCSKLAHLFL